MKQKQLTKWLWILLFGASLAPATLFAQFVYPVNGTVPTGGEYGACRDGCSRLHLGLDISGSTGTTVGAGYAGTASFVGISGSMTSGYGQLVILNHSSNYQTYYAHLDSFIVSNGQSVLKNTDIARRGSTGSSTGPHVHYEIRRYGTQLFIPGSPGASITRNTAVPESYPGLDTDLLPAPILLSPLNGASNVSTTPTFGWTEVDGASAGYVIAVATSSSSLPTDPTDSSCSGCVIVTSGTSYTPSSALNSGTTYYWKVRGRGPGAIYGNWSGTFSFTTQSDQIPTPVIQGMSTTPSPPTTAGAFNFTISGSNFFPDGALIVVTGPGCTPCTIPNSALTTKTTTTLAGSYTLSTAGTYSFVVQNGYDGQTGGPGPQSSAVNVTVVTDSYAITASAGSGGGISPSGSFTKSAGSSQAFSASPNANYVVNQWLVDGGVVQNGGTGYTLSNIQANRSVHVTFTLEPTRVISLSGNLAFGDVAVGTSAQRTLTIANIGNSTLTVSSISYPSGFSGNWSGTITAGDSQNVAVTFSPSVVTSYGGTVTVNSDKTSGVNTIAASGTGTSTSITMVISVSGNLSFGNVAVGSSAQQTLMIANSGNATLTVSSISYPSGFSGNWSGTIPPSGSQNVTVTFSPTSETSYGGSLMVHSDATSGSGSMAVSGVGGGETSLVAHYPFDGNADDASANANHGIVYGAFADVNRHGVPSSSLKFAGTTNWVRLNIGPEVFANDFTMAVWIKVDDFEAYYPTIIGGDNGYVRWHVLGSEPGHISLGLLGKSQFYQFQPSPWAQFGVLLSATPLETNHWYHLAVTKSGLDYRLYLNGVLSDSKIESGTPPLTGSYLQVGNDLASSDNQHYFHGNMDDLRIYNRALSADEIQFFLAAPPRRLEIAWIAGQIVISWNGTGSLEEAEKLAGPWIPVANPASPFRVTPTGVQRFWRLRQ